MQKVTLSLGLFLLRFLRWKKKKAGGLDQIASEEYSQFQAAGKGPALRIHLEEGSGRGSYLGLPEHLEQSAEHNRRLLGLS